MHRVARYCGSWLRVVLQPAAAAAIRPPVAVPPPPASTQLALDALNYQGAVQTALETVDAAFAYAKLGADVADRLFNTSLIVPPALRCPVSGTVSITHTDRNRDGMLNLDDTVHMFLDRCISTALMVTGVVRVEIISAAPIGDCRVSAVVNTAIVATSRPGSPRNHQLRGTLAFSTPPVRTLRLSVGD